MARVKILKGRKRYSIKEISDKDAACLSELREVEILESREGKCAARTDKDLPCKLNAKENSRYCWRHQED